VAALKGTALFLGAADGARRRYVESARDRFDEVYDTAAREILLRELQGDEANAALQAARTLELPGAAAQRRSRRSR